MLSPRSYAQISDPTSPQLWERDTITCGHCGTVVFVKPGSATTVYQIQGADGRWHEEPGAACRCCMRAVCLPCHDAGRCLPLEALLEQLEGRPRRLVV